MPGKSTTGRILALCLQVERRREFLQGILVTSVDLKNTFNSVHIEALWYFLRLPGIPASDTGLMTGLHSETEIGVKSVSGEVVNFLAVNT